MQASLGKSKITNNDKLVLDVMADRYCIQILQAINTEPKSVSQLSSECGIFLGVAYRKLNVLKKAAYWTHTVKLDQTAKNSFYIKAESKVSWLHL